MRFEYFSGVSGGQKSQKKTLCQYKASHQTLTYAPQKCPVLANNSTHFNGIKRQAHLFLLDILLLGLFLLGDSRLFCLEKNTQLSAKMPANTKQMKTGASFGHSHPARKKILRRKMGCPFIWTLPLAFDLCSCICGKQTRVVMEVNAVVVSCNSINKGNT